MIEEEYINIYRGNEIFAYSPLKNIGGIYLGSNIKEAGDKLVSLINGNETKNILLKSEVVYAQRFPRLSIISKDELELIKEHISKKRPNLEVAVKE